MSYILDALRRADSERERGAVPDIHAQPVPAVADDADADDERRGTPPLVWAVVALLLALIAWLLWQLLLGRAEPPHGPPPSAMAEGSLQPPPALPAPMQAQAQPPDAAVAPALEPAPPLQLPSEPQMPHRPPPREAGADMHAKAPQNAPQSAAPGAPPAAPAQQQPQADTGNSRIYARHELPGHIQRELPQLSIGGSVYSEDPSKRFVIINGSIVHEGDKPMPGLVLEQIKLKSAVLRYKDYRYEIGY